MKEKFMQPVVETQERPETRVEKLFGNLKEQYFDQVRVLNETGVLELLPESGELGIVDVNGKEQPVPTYDQLIEMFEAKYEADTNFDLLPQLRYTELVLVPYGMPINELVNRFRTELVAKINRDLVVAGGNPETRKMFDVEFASLSDVEGAEDGIAFSETQLPELMYHAQEPVNAFMRKTELVEKSSTVSPGWQCLLFNNTSSLGQLRESSKPKGSRPIALEDWLTNSIISLKRDDEFPIATQLGGSVLLDQVGTAMGCQVDSLDRASSVESVKVLSFVVNFYYSPELKREMDEFNDEKRFQRNYPQVLDQQYAVFVTL